MCGDIWNWDVLEELAAEQGQERVGMDEILTSYIPHCRPCQGR